MSRNTQHGIRDATADPGVSDDITEQIRVLTPWLNESTNRIFICADNADGAAVWKPITGAQLFSFDVNEAIYPASNPAQAGSRNGHPLLDFDDTTDETIIFNGKMSRDYAGGNFTLDIDWVAASAIIGDVKWDVSFERVAPGGQDIDSDGFAAIQTATETTSGTSGVVTRTSITFTQAQADSIAAGDTFRLKITRDASVAGDVVGDAQIRAVAGRQ